MAIISEGNELVLFDFVSNISLWGLHTKETNGVSVEKRSQSQVSDGLDETNSVDLVVEFQIILSTNLKTLDRDTLALLAFKDAFQVVKSETRWEVRVVRVRADTVDFLGREELHTNNDLILVVSLLGFSNVNDMEIVPSEEEEVLCFVSSGSTGNVVEIPHLIVFEIANWFERDSVLSSWSPCVFDIIIPVSSVVFFTTELVSFKISLINSNLIKSYFVIVILN